ncbi:GNAT family N-acetyltransferase [Microvirga flavescens]|uniref:GNAT family N-acetyltransferase n=1 Tax=Microvirga flavescens TaxID=2249811 RepID=UPI001300BC52|nr:GNAT family N-acetyltransferase [Microvirga flavescens]
MIDIRLLDAKATQADRAQLAETLADCVAGGASVGFMWPYPVEEAHRWWGGVIEKIAAGDTVLFAAYVDGVLSGTVQLGLDTPPNQPHRGDVKKLLVHRRARKQGLASHLLTALEEEARRRSLTLLTLDTVTGSNAEQLYAKLGWTKSGIIPNYALFPDGSFCDTTVFWKVP